MGIGLHLLAHLMHGLPADPDFTGNFGGRVAFADPPHQEHRLGWSKGPAFKDGPAIKIVNPLARATAVDPQLAGLGLPKLTGLIQSCPTVGTLQPVRMKVFKQPLATEFIIK